MPQIQIYLNPELDKKVVAESKQLNISKVDVLQKIIEEHFKEGKI